jgi:hypothetical protein
VSPGVNLTGASGDYLPEHPCTYTYIATQARFAMKYLIRRAAIVLCASSALAAADHFPIAQGNAWLFSYKHVSGGWGVSTIDSGTIKWDIGPVFYGAAVPGGVTAHFTIRQTKSLCRRIYNPGSVLPGSGAAYDSIYVPFRVTVDSFAVASNGVNNGFAFPMSDTCWSFAHNPQDPSLAGKIAVRDTALSYSGKSLSASIIDPSPCRNPYSDVRYFITADSLGPVGYHTSSSPFIMDAFWQEDWSLVWTNLAHIDGGPCAYSKYIGTALITRLEKAGSDIVSGAYSAYFRFGTSNSIRETWADSSARAEKNISTITGLAGNLGQFRIKPGNAYVCTLDVINIGSCTPLIYHLKPSAATDDIDTSWMWTMPDSVVENRPFDITLFSYSFSCNTIFSMQSFSRNAGTVQLDYKAIDLPTAGICGPSACLYGTSFSSSGLAAGKYAVYSVQEPECAPQCDIAVQSKLVDTLTVVDALSVKHPAVSGKNAFTAKIVGRKGRLVFEGEITKPGKIFGAYYSPNGALLGTFATAWLSAGFNHIIVPDGSGTAKGTVIVRLNLPDGKIVTRMTVRM